MSLTFKNERNDAGKAISVRYGGIDIAYIETSPATGFPTIYIYDPTGGMGDPVLTIRFTQNKRNAEIRIEQNFFVTPEPTVRRDGPYKEEIFIFGDRDA